MSLWRWISGRGRTTLLLQSVSSLSTVLIALILATRLNVDEFAVYALPSSLWAAAAGIVQLSVVLVAVFSWVNTDEPAHIITGFALTMVLWGVILALLAAPAVGPSALAAGLTCGAVMVLYDATKRLYVAMGTVWRGHYG